MSRSTVQVNRLGDRYDDERDEFDFSAKDRRRDRDRDRLPRVPGASGRGLQFNNMSQNFQYGDDESEGDERRESVFERTDDFERDREAMDFDELSIEDVAPHTASKTAGEITI